MFKIFLFVYIIMCAFYEPPEKQLAIFDPLAFMQNDIPLTIESGSKYFLRFPNAQDTENFNKLSANEIIAPGDLKINPVGSINMNGKVLNMTNGEIHNCPLIHSRNNQDIVIEGKGTGKVILKTNNSDSVSVLSSKITLQKDLEVESSTTNVKVYNVNFKDMLDGTNNSNLYQFDNEFKFQNISNSGIIDFITNDASGVQTTVLEASSTSVIIRKPLDMSNNSIINCPLIQTASSTNLLIDAQGVDSEITLRVNLLNTLKIGPVGVQPYKPIYMSAPDFLDRSIYSGALFLINNVNGGEVGRLSMDVSLVLVENRANLGNIIFQTRDASSATTNVLEVSSASATIRRPILMTDASSNNRVVNSSTLQLNETTGGYNPTVLHQIYQTGGTANYINLIANGTTNISVVNDGSTLVTPLQITSTSNNIASNVNLAMAAGTGVINQGITAASTITNTLKKTAVIINSGLAIGSATSGFEVYDEGVGAGAGRGLLILPNSGGGSFSSFNMANDCALISRSPQNNNAISITNWNSDMRNGIRIATSDVSNCLVSIQNGSGSAFSEFRMAFNRTLNTFTNTFNNPIDFNPTTYGAAISPARRLLSGLGTLRFTDISGNDTGGTTTSTITMNSAATVSGLNFDCSLNSGNHNFTVNDPSGNKINPFSVGSSVIRHNVPTIMSDFTVPLNLSYAGGLLTGFVDDTSISSAVGTRELTNYLLVSKGTYIVNANFRFSSLLNDADVDRLMCGIGNTSAAFNAGGQFSTGVFRNDSLFTIQNPGTERRISTTVLSISSSNTTIYFNYLLDFTSASTLMSIGLTYSITRIA
jgi:hypothetical protein